MCQTTSRAVAILLQTVRTAFTLCVQQFSVIAALAKMEKTSRSVFKKAAVVMELYNVKQKWQIQGYKKVVIIMCSQC